ncbi:glutamate/tyrosine decarboxylase-like PLP-dependent enzyme [Chitinophaga skermanii]|uniref:Glutamate/tyrosine decarboxylase-like PLP-dependent enzyme n=1 Tax=Chitinophaga skermanii TaxID=331697 RepID=A0A327QW61_9BACT|nr:pyridoxal-dependent decarboxylase [Chitinophaga skermanii]RAJ08906.1 glutamate/tyrosine decarboxylase-like PLP-dependent enzyme [Chitinophaga skermanii]
MNTTLQHDHDQFDELLTVTKNWCAQYLQKLESLPVHIAMPVEKGMHLPVEGAGAAKVFEAFLQQYGAYISGNAGARYLGFVTGGTTPAALMGDWLTSVIDMNGSSMEAPSMSIEQQTISFLQELFGLPPAFTGAFVSGATMANFTGLAVAREWWGEQHGVNISDDGLHSAPPVKIISCKPHSSAVKSLSMLGLGRNSFVQIPTLPNREAIDVQALSEYIQQHPAKAYIIAASAATVNTADFDDIQALVALKKHHNIYIHLDAAFGGFAACSDRFKHLLKGWESVDSITVDAHKWMNVPYDSALIFSKHPSLQLQIFKNIGAAYLGDPSKQFSYTNYGPENSRRLRALPAWFSLMAYGKSGYAHIVENNVDLAKAMGKQIQESEQFELLSPVHLNTVCFTLKNTRGELSKTVKIFLQTLNKEGKVFITATEFAGKPAMRAAFVNWRTTQQDLDIVMHALHEVYAKTS